MEPRHRYTVPWDSLGKEKRERARGLWVAYRTAQHAVPLFAALLNVVLQGGRIQGLQELETAEQFARD